MNRLKSLRLEKDLYRSDIAKIIGVTTSAHSFYENGKRDMSTDIVIKLSKFFDVSVDYLLGISDERRSSNENNQEFIDFYENYKELEDDDKDILKAMFEAIKKKKKK